MKKTFSFLLGLLFVSFFFVSCEGDFGGGLGDSGSCLISVESAGNGSVSITNNIGNSVNVLSGNQIEVVAVPDEGYVFAGWFVDGEGEAISKEEAYTFTVENAVTLVAKFRWPFVATGSEEGYDYVDLGLPSGVKWATCNVGAISIEESGGYYAWGETYDKIPCNWMHYSWCDGTADFMEKYCINSAQGSVDGKKVLDAEDDAACEEWGGSWRTPTSEELKELLDKCSWVTFKVNKKLGYKVEGPNGNSIFIPAAGYHTDPYTTIILGHFRYWSGSLDLDNNERAYCLKGFAGQPNQVSKPELVSNERCLGYKVRAVFK